MSDKKLFMLIPTESTNLIDFNEVNENLDTVDTVNFGKKLLVSWYGITPPSIQKIPYKEGPFNEGIIQYIIENQNTIQPIPTPSIKDTDGNI